MYCEAGNLCFIVPNVGKACPHKANWIAVAYRRTKGRLIYVHTCKEHADTLVFAGSYKISPDNKVTRNVARSVYEYAGE